MNRLTMQHVATLALSVCLLVSQVDCHISGHSAGSEKRGLTIKTDSSSSSQLEPQAKGSGSVLGSCEEGWLYSHGHCFKDTGMGSGAEAREVCSRHGAQEARGICVKQSAIPVESKNEHEEEVVNQGASLSSASDSDSDEQELSFVCPKGWTRYEEFCFFRPSSAPRVCELLGAGYLFDYCITRVPHKVPTDFMTAVKRLQGSNYDMHRDTRLCCCGGRMGFC